MFALEGLALLESRKVALLGESQAIRQQLQRDWAVLEPAVCRMESGLFVIGRIWSFCSVAAPFVQLVAGRRQPSDPGWRNRFGDIWRVGRAAAAAWKFLQKADA